jgi:hypothetical protein
MDGVRHAKKYVALGKIACPTEQHSRNQMWGGPPGSALPVFEQVDQGIDRGPGCEGLRVV